MTYKVKQSILISEKTVQRRGGVVVLPVKEYKKLLEKAIPTYYLPGREAEKLDKLVEQGLREYKEGKTIDADSLKGALSAYGKKGKR